ncbi:MAG: fibronectin type III domain-containing protein [Bifidobacterium sp.]|nr:fibronectin type III domain-containing protein [Bifidobacterium sp.]
MIMADGYGGIVAGSWRCHVAAWVVSQTNTQAVIRVEARFQAVNGWHFQINGVNGTVKCDGQSASGSGNATTSTNGEVVIVRKDFTVTKKDSARSVACSATVSQSAFNGGTSSASCSVTVGAIPYQKPNAPKNVTVTRENDTSIMTRWAGNWDNANLKPWKQVAVGSRQGTGGAGWGAWGRRATLNWDATSYRVTGLKENTRNQIALFAINQAGESTHVDSAIIYMTPAAPKSVQVVKKSETQILVTVDVSNSYAYRVNLQRYVNGARDTSFPTTALTISNQKATYTDDALPAGDISYQAQVSRPIYGDDVSKGVGYSAYTKSGTVTTIQQPLAPTITAPADATTYPTGTAVDLTWVANHPDRSAQGKAQIELGKPDGTVQSVNIDGAASTYTVTGSAKGSWKARVRTKGLDPQWGAWSGWVTWKQAIPPDVTILEPGIVDASPFTVAWSIADETGVSQQTVEIKVGDDTVYTASPASGVRSWEVTPQMFLPSNGDELLITVKVRGGSTLTAQESRTVSVQYTPPARPSVELTVVDGYAMMVRVGFNRTNPGGISQPYGTRNAEDGTSVLDPLEDGDYLPSTIRAMVERVNPDGSAIMIADNLQDGDMVIDPLVPLNIEVTYRVTAFSAANSTDSTIVETMVESDRPVFNFGQAAEQALPVGGAWKVSEHPVRSTQEYHFADDSGLPLSYATGEMDNSVSVSSAYLYDADLHRFIRSLSREHSRAWLRLIDGSRMRCSLSMSQSLNANGQMVDFQADCTELTWQEAQVG